MSFEFTFKNYTFSPRPIPTLLALLCIPTLIFLGLWQLDRAEEKRVIDQGVNDAIKKPALPFNDADLTSLNKEIYRSGALTGHFDKDNQFLLDNRTHNGQPGYHVFSPFLFENKSSEAKTQHAVLINRGWIGYQGTRDLIADISLDSETKTISGAIKKLPRSIVLNDSVRAKSPTASFRTKDKQLVGLHLTQSIQLERLEKVLNYELLPVMIELDKTFNNGFVRDWQPYYGSIDKHNAYALQWFAMAAILLFLFFKLNIRKR